MLLASEHDIPSMADNVCVRERRGLSKHKETGMVRDGNLAL
jgi:hypothetical protein